MNNRDKVLFKQTVAKKVDVIPNLDVSFWLKTSLLKVGWKSQFIMMPRSGVNGGNACF